MKAPLSYVPALSATLGWIAGILLWWIGGVWWLAAAITTLGIVLMLRHIHFLAFGLICVGSGWLAAALNAPAQAPEGIFDGRERRYCAIVDHHGYSETSQTFILCIDSIETSNGHFAPLTPFKIQASALAECDAPAIGSRIHLNATIEPLQAGEDYIGQPDRTTYYLQHAIVATAYIDLDSIAIVGHHSSISSFFADRRERILSLLAHSGLNDEAFGVLAALLVAYDDELSPDIRENFRATGIAHALALSGFHVGIIVMFVGILLLPLQFFPKLRRLRIALSIIVVWLYVVLVGAPLSVVRAAVMLSIYLAGLIVGSPANSYNSLCVALLIILAYSPFSVFSAGLQLSGAAVIGILAFAHILNPIDPHRRVAHAVVGTLTISIAALLGTMVITACHFHRLPLLFFVSNLFITPLLPLLMLGGITIAALSAMGISCGFVVSVANFVVEIAEQFVGFLASLPMAEVNGIYLSDIAATALICLTIIGAIAVNLNSRRAYIALVATAVVALSLTMLTRPDYSDEEVTVLRNRNATTLLLRSGSQLTAIPLCSAHDLPFIAEKLRDDIADYASSRGVDSVEITINDFDRGNFSRHGAMLNFGTTKALIASQKADADSIRVDYLIFSRSSRDKLDKLFAGIAADTVVICAELNQRRAAQIIQACHQRSLPTIDLRHHPWHPKQ